MRACGWLAILGAAAAGSLLAADGRTRSGEEPYVFTLNGKRFTPTVYSLEGTPETPCEGDVIEVAWFRLTLGEERRCCFTTSIERSGSRLLLETRTGEARIVAAAFDAREHAEAAQGSTTARAAMSDADIAALWGISISDWNGETKRYLTLIDARRTCVTVRDGPSIGGKCTVPSLPSDLSYLSIRGAYETLAPLRGLAGLVYLEFDADLDRGGLDASVLERCRRLRYLRFRPGSTIENRGSLGALGELRVLEMARVAVPDISFASRMPHLRAISLGETPIEDLTPLSGLSELVRIDGDGAPVRRLPAGTLPALKHVTLLSAPVDSHAVADFRKLNPACILNVRWIDPLRTALDQTTRIQVRKGGACCRRAPDAEQLTIVPDLAEAKTLLAGLEIDEAESRGSCDCCGDTAFDLYAGDRCIASVGFKHAAALCWPSTWRYDAVLAPASVQSLCQWFARLGFDAPEKHRTREERMRAASRARLDACTALLPKGMAPDGSVAAALETAVPDETERAILCYKLFGCDDHSWNIATELDDVVRERLLPAISAEARLAAARRVVDDPMGANGAARWLFGEQNWADHESRSLADLVPTLAERALAHPRAIARRRTIFALGDMETETSFALLRKVVSGTIALRAAADGDEEFKIGEIIHGPVDSGIEGASDQALAAVVLARHGDTQSAARIRALAAEAKEPDKEAYEEALELLDALK